MEKRTEGAWLLHHTKKLLDLKDTQEFDDIELAGKCGIFLSNLAADDESDLNSDKVTAIARVSNIKKTEIDTIKNRLADSHLISLGKNGSISVLGITSSSVLTHTSDIFQELKPANFQKAAIDLSENISDLPNTEKNLKDYIGDVYNLSNSETNELFSLSEEAGFIDFELLKGDAKYYFNGNLFKKEFANKTNAVLSSIRPEEVEKINRLDAELTNKGCISEKNATDIVGEQLLLKLQSIGMYDFNDVSNSKESITFVTKPSAFSKFGNPFEEDAMDLAKAFVSALYYGMTHSTSDRGRISGNLKFIMRKLLTGQEVGPATAIGEDYRLLELKRVIKIRHEGGFHYYMTLLKKDIGELALQVLEFGDATERTSMPKIYTGSVTNYKGPEQKRESTRKKQNEQSKLAVANLIRTFRN